MDKRKIAKNAIALYLRMFIVLIVSLYTARVVLKELGASDYGIYNVVAGVVTMLNFMTGSLSQGLQRFFNFYKGRDDYENINKVFWSGIVILLLIGAIILIIGESLGLWFVNSQLNLPIERMDAANIIYQVSIFSMLISLMIVPFNAILISNEDFGIFAFISIGMSLLNLINSFILQSFSGDKLILYSILMCVVSVTQAITLISVCKFRYKKIQIVRHRDVGIFKSLLSFSGWNVLGTSMFMLSTQGVNIILNIFFGTIVNAARGVAIQVSTVVDDLINNIQQATNPQIVQLYSKGEYEAVQSLVYDNIRWNFSLYWLVALPLFFEIDFVLSLWLGTVPTYTPIFATIIIFRSLLKCFERPINSVNFAIGKMKPINLFSSCSMLISILLMFILFSIGLPPYWAFILDCTSIFCCVVYFMLHAQKYGLFSIVFFLKKVLSKIIFVIIGTFLVTYGIRLFSTQGLLQFFITLCSTMLSTLILVLYVLLTSGQRRAVIRYLKTKFFFQIKKN